MFQSVVTLMTIVTTVVPFYEIRYRSMTFYTSKYWVRPLQFEHLLAPEAREEVCDEPGDFIEVDVQDDAKS